MVLKSAPVAGRARRWWWVRRFGMVAVALILIEYLAVPQIVRATSDLTILADAAPLLLLLGFGLEVCSLASYTALTRAVLPSGVRPEFSRQLRIDLTGLGFSRVAPGGGASAAALRFRLMTKQGVPAGDAAATAAVQTAVAAIGLVATFAGGVALAGPGVRAHPAYVVSGVCAVAFLVLVTVGVRLLGRYPTGVVVRPRDDDEPSPALTTRRGRTWRWLIHLVASSVRAAASTVRRARGGVRPAASRHRPGVGSRQLAVRRRQLVGLSVGVRG